MRFLINPCKFFYFCYFNIVTVYKLKTGFKSFQPIFQKIEPQCKFFMTFPQNLLFLETLNQNFTQFLPRAIEKRIKNYFDPISYSTMVLKFEILTKTIFFPNLTVLHFYSIIHAFFTGFFVQSNKKINLFQSFVVNLQKALQSQR